MKKFNLPLNYWESTPNASPAESLPDEHGDIEFPEPWYQDEDVLRDLDPRWNEPQRQSMNGGTFNSKGEYDLDWDVRWNKRHPECRRRLRKARGLLEKGVGKKFDDVYSKLCRSGLADKGVWGYSTVRHEFMSEFIKPYNDYRIDDNGLIQHKSSKKRTKEHPEIRISYEDPIITYKVNHDNLKSVSVAFITELGVDLYYRLLCADEISKEEYNKYDREWYSDKCNKVMQSSRRAREYRPRFRYWGNYSKSDLLDFIFDRKYEVYKKILKYGTKEYFEYLRYHRKRKKDKEQIREKRKYYDAVMRYQKKFGNFSPVGFVERYNHIFCGEELPLTPCERREANGKPRWDS